MKSLALHLIVTLMLVLLLVGPSTFLLLTAASVTTLTATASTKTHTQTSTTTQQPPPPLQKPQDLLMTSTTTTTTMASSTIDRRSSSAKRQRELIARHGRRGSPPQTEVAREEKERTPPSNGVRQHRSLQSGTATAIGHNAISNSGDGDYESKRIERRRINQYTNGGAIPSSTKTTTTSSIPTSTTTTTTSTPSPDAARPMLENHRQAKHLNAERQTRWGGQQTLKSPRMIQRMVAGHIQNAEGRSTYQVSTVTTNSSVTASGHSGDSSQTPQNSTTATSSSYVRRKENMQSSSYLKSSSGSSTPTPVEVSTSKYEPTDEDHDDDEALLNSPDDFDNWDNGILRLSAGSGKETTKVKKNKDDSKTKTLSDQVKDGKYGLIEKELFRREPKRPGVLSYLRNKEVPTDNERNYGGLRDEDIWLAEDHLLVIKGGSLNDDEVNEPWPPIDDFESPPRQIKIPENAKVPPPFPVQLDENGPLQFIGNNKFTVVYPVANESIPVYPAGPEAKYQTSESDSDNEKNSIARPGSSKDPSTGGGQEPGGYIYPPPYPPWLYHNQTFVNPVLNSARPISFPGLGPFPFGRHNGSLDGNSNGTADDFDEDDPSLYYPPAYSFVYKSNYTNPVPAGPLVPGIVLPPPPNHFSRLEKKKEPQTHSEPFPPRHRPQVVTTTTTTTSTNAIPISTTTSTTTQPTPIYRPVYTKISEYTPKTIIITPEPPTSKSTPPSRLFSSTTPPSTRPIIQAVPVAVGVPIPVYPRDNYPSARPDIVSFVPTTPDPNVDTFSKSNPIYYEYFEAKRQPSAVTSVNAIDNFLATTAKTPPQSPKPIKIYATSKRPFKQHQHQPHRNFLQPINQPGGSYIQDNIVYITPKPEIRYKVGAGTPQAPIFKQRPLENFEREVDVLRETLRYYQNQQLRDNTIPRTPKAKPVYQYANKNNNQPVDENTPANFQPSGYDEEPFQPMVTYSPPVGDENAFRAIAYDKVDNELPQARQQHESKYSTTTTLVPVQPDPQYQSQQGRPKKFRLRAKYLQPGQIPANNYEQQQNPVNAEYQATPRTPAPSSQPIAPWQEYNEYGAPQQHQRQQSQRLQLPLRNRGFNGYYYNRPPPQAPPQSPQQQQPQGGHRQNTRFYDEPFQNGPVRKVVNYPQTQQQRPQQQQWSLANDTYVNYAPNRPPLNPDAEFIDPYETLPVNVYAQQQPQRIPLNPVPPISHQSQYYSASQQRFPTQRQQQQIPLHRDILVNYRQPLPPINPDSEYISHPQVVRNQANQIYRPNPYRAGDQANVYFIPPYRRSHSVNADDNDRASDINGGK